MKIFMRFENKIALFLLMLLGITLVVEAQDKRNSRPVTVVETDNPCEKPGDNIVQLNVSVWDKNYNFLKAVYDTYLL